jgi:hypothetical protein
MSANEVHSNDAFGVERALKNAKVHLKLEGAIIPKEL